MEPLSNTTTSRPPWRGKARSISSRSWLVKERGANRHRSWEAGPLEMRAAMALTRLPSSARQAPGVVHRLAGGQAPGVVHRLAGGEAALIQVGRGELSHLRPFLAPPALAWPEPPAEGPACERGGACCAAIWPPYHAGSGVPGVH